MRRAFVIIVLAFVALPAAAGEADDRGKLSWPQFRGPDSAGIGDCKPPVEFGPAKNVLWKVAVGAGLSSPVIAGRDRKSTRLNSSHRL